MKFPIEEHLPYFWLTLSVLGLFYGIYFVKMFLQKRQGIRTNQIGRRKERGLHTVELLMGTATLCAPAAQLLSVFLGWNYMPAGARFTGFCIGMLGDLIFLVSVVSMRDSWRAGIPDGDRTELVTDGIYRFSRNPAFLGFDLMYVGVLLLYCNPLTAVFSLFAMVMLHLQILQEEKYLLRTFGDAYAVYRSQVFRYLGRRTGCRGVRKKTCAGGEPAPEKDAGCGNAERKRAEMNAGAENAGGEDENRNGEPGKNGFAGPDAEHGSAGEQGTGGKAPEGAEERRNDGIPAKEEERPS